jgi:hypothetical protein
LSPVSRPHPPTPNPQRLRRAGITLLEVLISMFVLLIGLMGVGAMIPAGRYEIMQGVKADYGTTVGRAAFRDLKARGYLNPKNWADTTGNPVYNPATMQFVAAVGGPLQPAVAIDPLGVLATPTTFGPNFPNPLPDPPPTPSLARLNLFQAQSPLTPMTKTVADAIFRCTDDLITLPSLVGRDSPPLQSSVPFNPNPLIPIYPIMGRASEGNYSWLATIVTDTSDPNASALSSKVTVSVAVFYKRDLSEAGAKEASVGAFLFGGSEFRLFWTSGAMTKFPEGVRAGQWIMLEGDDPGGQRKFRWYRVLGAAKVDATTLRQEITLAGADWNPTPTNTRAWLFQGVIAVFEKNMQLEVE